MMTKLIDVHCFLWKVQRKEVNEYRPLWFIIYKPSLSWCVLISTIIAVTFLTTVWCTARAIRSIVYTKKRIRKGESGIKLNNVVMTKEQSAELKKSLRIVILCMNNYQFSHIVHYIQCKVTRKKRQNYFILLDCF